MKKEATTRRIITDEALHTILATPFRLNLIDVALNLDQTPATAHRGQAIIEELLRQRELERACWAWFCRRGIDGRMYAPSDTFSTEQEKQARAAIGRLLEGTDEYVN